VLNVLFNPGTQGIPPGYFFAPVGHQLNVLVRRRAPAALSIACPLPCCIGPIMDHVVVWCGFTPSTIGDCFSSSVRQYLVKLPRWGSRVLTVSFPSPAQPLPLRMICEEKIHYDFPCFVASFISLFILVGLGSQLLGG